MNIHGHTIFGLFLLGLAPSVMAQNYPGRAGENQSNPNELTAQNVRPTPPNEPRKVWVLPPSTTKEIREQAWRNRTSVQFVEPAYSAMGEPTFRKISVNCFEPSVSIQYMENRRMYNGLYIQDVGGWSDENTSGRRLPVDVEPSAADLQRYLQQGCSGQMYPQPLW